MRDKIRILFLSADPVDKGLLRLSEEVRAFDERITLGSAKDAFELTQQFALRPNDLQQALLKYQPHIVHFSGHRSLTKEILLEERSGKSSPVTGKGLAELFRILRDNVRIVFFDACFSMSQAEAISSVIDYTVGTNKAVGDQAAVAFAVAFYRALAFGRSVISAFELAKTEIDLVRIPGGDTPVLLIRAGVDREQPFLSLSEGSDEKVSERLRMALVHLAAGNANAGTGEGSKATTVDGEVTRADTKVDTREVDAGETLEFALVPEDEMSLIRRELINGKVVIEQIEGAAETESDVMAALSHINSTRPIHIEVGEATYRRIQDQLYPSPPGLPPPLPGLMFVGRQESLTDVKKLLGVGQAAQRTGNLTVVRGWPGVGKTTLVGVLARDPEIAKAFPDGVLWTALEQNPDLMSKIAAWGRALGTDELLRIPGIEEATEKLGLLLHDKRMLLIVDDIWNVAHALPFLRAVANSRCALLATTRLTSVADALAQSDTSRSPDESVYVLPVLTEEDALTLLRYLAPGIVEDHIEECRELVRDLECLPLALHISGRLLKHKAKMGFDVVDLFKEIREVTLFTELEPAPLDRAEGATIPTVGALFRQSTDQLDELTRECFAYLGVFAPKPATFDVGALKAVWMVDDPKPIIRKLVGQGLLEPIGAGRFQMHALLVQHARSLLS
jgi:hypothetical protein